MDDSFPDLIIKFLMKYGDDVAERYRCLIKEKAGQIEDYMPNNEAGLSLPKLVSRHLALLSKDFAREFEEAVILFTKFHQPRGPAAASSSHSGTPGSRREGSRGSGTVRLAPASTAVSVDDYLKSELKEEVVPNDGTEESADDDVQFVKEMPCSAPRGANRESSTTSSGRERGSEGQNSSKVVHKECAKWGESSASGPSETHLAGRSPAGESLHWSAETDLSDLNAEHFPPRRVVDRDSFVSEKSKSLASIDHKSAKRFTKETPSSTSRSRKKARRLISENVSPSRSSSASETDAANKERDERRAKREKIFAGSFPQKDRIKRRTKKATDKLDTKIPSKKPASKVANTKCATAAITFLARKQCSYRPRFQPKVHPPREETEPECSESEDTETDDETAADRQRSDRNLPVFPSWMTETWPKPPCYFPQIGDELYYFRKEHATYIKAASKQNPWSSELRKLPSGIGDCEPVKLVGLKFLLRSKPGTVESLRLAEITLETMRSDRDQATFTVCYYEVVGVEDFLILKGKADSSLYLYLKRGQTVKTVYTGKNGGLEWWWGRIDCFKTKTADSVLQNYQRIGVWWFPDLSQKDANFLSPWDLNLVEEEQSTEYVCGTPVTKDELIEMAPVSREVDWGGDPTWVKERILMLIEELRAVPRVDLFLCSLQHWSPNYAAVVSYPMDLNTIADRVKNGFYRRIDAAIFDIKQIAINAAAVYGVDSDVALDAKIVPEVWKEVVEVGRPPNAAVRLFAKWKNELSRKQDEMQSVPCAAT